MWLFGAIEGTSLASGFDAGAVQGAADDVITDTWQIFDTTATNHDGAVFLKVVAFPADVGGDFISVGQTDTSVFAKSGVWLLRGHCANTSANATLLGGWLVGLFFRKGIPSLAEGRSLGFLDRALAALSYELVDRRHLDSPLNNISLIKRPKRAVCERW